MGYVKAIGAAAVVMFAPWAATAAEFGWSMSASKGEIEPKDLGFSLPSGFEIDSTSYAVQFAMNTCEGCSVMNYRLNVGYRYYDIDYNIADLVDRGNGFEITNTLGFKFVNNANLRAWAGPAVYLGYVHVDGDVTDSEWAAVYGYGATVGVDFLGGGDPIISFEIGLRDAQADIGNGFIDEYELEDIFASVTFLF